eukprot:COSAG04_NODE_5142_length_1722_cov_1.274184_2_plen_211_part_00
MRLRSKLDDKQATLELLVAEGIPAGQLQVEVDALRAQVAAAEDAGDADGGVAIPEAEPPASAGSAAAAKAELDAFAVTANLSAFMPALEARGVATKADLAKFSNDELAELGMRKIDINRFKRRLQAAGVAVAEEPQSPSPREKAPAPAPPPAPAGPARSAEALAAEAQCREMGFGAEAVERAQQAIIQAAGQPFEDTMMLMEAVMQDDGV